MLPPAAPPALPSSGQEPLKSGQRNHGPACYHWAVPSLTAPHRVAIFVYDGVTLLDVAGPAEVFKEANRFGADYRITLLSPTGADVTSNLGVRMSVDGAASSEPAFDTLLVAGSDLYPPFR